MSFLDGLSGLASGLSKFTANVAQDTPEPVEPKAAPILASAAAAKPPAEAAPAASDAPAAAAPAASAAPGSAIPAGVPADLVPIYQAASKRTGIPVAILIAQGKQESGFRSDAVGSAGEIGISQIKPSTAAQPGYGMKGIDPSTLKDPAVNINFAADYLRARAGGAGVDFADPTTVNRGLAAYNAGGDKNYVANVRSHIGGS